VPIRESVVKRATPDLLGVENGFAVSKTGYIALLRHNQIQWLVRPIAECTNAWNLQAGQYAKYAERNTERNAAQGLASLLAAIQATYRSAAEALMGV
jgi:hypothetical protein